MKKAFCIKFCLFASMGIFLILLRSCQKESIEGSVTDIEGNVYQTVKIDRKWWMSENLKVTLYRNGDSIPNVNEAADWIELETGAYCDYENTPVNSEIYGRLYNWHAVSTRKLCPVGWHTPNISEWNSLTDYAGHIANAAGKLKESGTAHWVAPNDGATNETGFTAIPGGYREWDYGLATFRGIGTACYFWSSTEYISGFNPETDANPLYMWVNEDNVSFIPMDKRNGYSVRCVKD